MCLGLLIHDYMCLNCDG
ncbi:hypothetical protein F383_16323 [Gossypium arboreum]|uniref:Uncharacterized protein n=1 Tax=Gossypium arboreum TaxID=29729 RepID=A0A0B0PUM3_GOSAR|nr:hypothetical protein F383_16323 [Gossypium arboreum]